MLPSDPQIPVNPAIGVSFQDLVISGGDNRLAMLESGANKYNVSPIRDRFALNRASCTCSPFTEDGYQAALSLYRKLEQATSFVEARNCQTERIKQLINYDGLDRFDVFYAPSGSDLCYYPLLFSRLIHSNRKIMNVITCPEELGSGSVLAYGGKYYFDENQMGLRVNKGQLIAPELNIQNISFPARAANGEINNHWPAVLQTIHDNYLTHSINVNLVIGSKSGIENNVAMLSHAPEDVLWTIDLCQFRASPKLINGLLGMNCSVMLTGSKFYQSPPFCAVLLVPKTVTRMFQHFGEKEIGLFRHVFSAFDIPEEFPRIRKNLLPYQNYGLLLRWEAALVEMQATAVMDTHVFNQIINDWSQFVTEQLEQSNYFSLMPGQEITNKTIISFRVRNQKGEYLNHQQLKEFYKDICGPQQANGAGGKVLIGQPVQYGDRSFIRIALGASDIRKFAHGGFDPQRDRALIQLLEERVRDRF